MFALQKRTKDMCNFYNYEFLIGSKRIIRYIYVRTRNGCDQRNRLNATCAMNLITFPSIRLHFYFFYVTDD